MREDEALPRPIAVCAAATVDSFDSADALRNAIQFIPEDYYDLPIAVLPTDEKLPTIDAKLAY